MKNNFNYFTLSIFKKCDSDSLSKAIYDCGYIKRAVDENCASIFSESLTVEQYFNAAPGGRYERFSWWSNPKYPDMVFLTSNISDGLDSLSKRFRINSNCELIQIRVSIDGNGEKADCFWFEFDNQAGEDRVVYALKEDRWVFYEEGEPLPIENTEYYKRRMIKQRLNLDIIVEYLSKLGINLWDIDSEVSQCMTFERTAWNPD